MRASGVTAAPSVEAKTESPSIYGYYEKLYHLTGYNPMSSYLKNMGGKDVQIPTLASSSAQSSGVYYVDNSSDLDILYLNNSTVRTIAAIVPLYQLFGYNEMLDDEFFIESNYHQALFFGTTTAGGRTYSIELVDLDTGSVRMLNTTAAVDGANQQPIYVGNDTVVVLSSNKTIDGYNLVSGEHWNAGATSWFEANNIYWIPQLQQLINVQAGGSTADEVQQLNASYDAFGRIEFSLVTSVTVDSKVRFNFVNGIGFNASTRQLAFSAGYFGGDAVATYVLQYTPSYVLSSSLAAKYSVLPGTSPLLFTGQQYVFISPYVLGWNIGGTQYLFNPWTGTSMPANRTFQAGVPCANSCFEGLYASSPDFMLDYNASLGNESDFYNVVYAYHNATNPYPLSDPAAPTGLAGSLVTTTTVLLSWMNPIGNLTADIVLQADFDASCGVFSSVYSPSSVFTSYSATGLQSGSEYCFEVEAANSAGASTPTSSLILTTIAGAPTNLAQSRATPTSVTLTWTAPPTSPSPGVISSYTVLQAEYALSCGSYSTSYSGVSDPYTVMGLTLGSAYCFEAEAVDSGGTSAASLPIANATPLPSLAVTPSSIDFSQQTSTLTLGISGAFSPYAWTLEVNGTSQNLTGASGLAYTFNPRVTGVFTFYLNVTGSNHHTVGVSASLTVDPALVVSTPSAIPDPVSVYQTTGISLAPSGGSTPYSFVWHGLPKGCSTSSEAQLSCAPTVKGTFSVSVTVTDANQVSVTSGSLALSVTKRSDSMKLTCPTSDVDTGTPETCTVVVTDMSPGTVGTPTGTVTVSIKGPNGFAAQRSCTLVGSGGTAICHVTFTPSRTGTYNLTANYPGDGRHRSTTATVTLVAGPPG